MTTEGGVRKQAAFGGAAGQSYAVKKMRAHSQLVQLLKVCLPVGAMVLASLVIVYAATYRPSSSITSTNVAFDATEVRMLHPKYTGRDEADRAYTVVADTARRKHDNPHLVWLDQIKANVVGQDEPGFLLTALSGVFETEKRLLELTGDIRVRSADGYDLATEFAEANLKAGLITGDREIVANGPLGDLRADGFQVNRNDKHIRFIGNVRVRITSD
ncbi:MAG: LPS export ABC transporter periplasmic protein LptC [Pseudomonadota bacterium]